MERFFISLRNLETQKMFTVYLRPTQHALSKFWQQTIKSNFLKNPQSKPLNKNFCFHAWQTQWVQPSYSRNLSTLCDMLNESIQQVNYYYGSHGYQYIDLVFSIDSLQDNVWYRSAMNQLHHHFETLIGQVGNTSDWYHKPGVQIACWHVQQLNALLHEIEATVNNIQCGNGEKCILINYSGPHMDGSYDPEPVRYNLEAPHYDCFQDTQHSWGMLTAYYSQLGKQHIEVFVDNDQDIAPENISGIQYMLGECILTLGSRSPDSPHLPRMTQEFRQWLVDNNYDPEDKKLALGLGVLANIHPEDNRHLGNTWQEIDQAIHQMDDVYRVGFIDADGCIICDGVYDYSWQEYRSTTINNMMSLARVDHS